VYHKLDYMYISIYKTVLLTRTRRLYITITYIYIIYKKCRMVGGFVIIFIHKLRVVVSVYRGGGAAGRPQQLLLNVRTVF
jgi:hypothetical protein